MARKTNILVVESDDSVRESLARVLEAEQFGVLLAATAPEALATAATHEIDVLLLDLHSAHGHAGGWETLQRLKALQPHLSLIILQNDSSSTTFLHNTHPLASAAVFFEKPIPDLDLLVKHVKGLTGGTPACVPPRTATLSPLPTR